jgi:hypothetical protein
MLSTAQEGTGPREWLEGSQRPCLARCPSTAPFAEKQQPMQLYAGTSAAIASSEQWRGRRALLASIIASVITFIFFLSCPAV